MLTHTSFCSVWFFLQAWGSVIREVWRLAQGFVKCVSLCACACVCVCMALCSAGRDGNRGSWVSNRGSADACPAESCKVPPFDRVSIQSQWAGSKPARQAAAPLRAGAVQEVSLIHRALSCKWTHPRLNNSWNFYVCSLAFFFSSFSISPSFPLLSSLPPSLSSSPNLCPLYSQSHWRDIQSLLN